jgi:CheY-like chemotaxis protein
VDDNDDTREMLFRLLASSGFDVRAAADGNEALAAATANPPDVILMDLAMPGLNGWEATRRLKTTPHTAHIPIIALSAHATPHYREVALAAGCAAFLAKPCPLDDLLGHVRRAVARPR